MKTESKYCLIVTGGLVDQNLLATVYEGAYGYPVHPYVIGVDKGLEMLEQLDIEPDLIIGDFDSANDGIRAKYVTSPDAVVREKCVVLNPEKDFTDTHVAVLEAANVDLHGHCCLAQLEPDSTIHLEIWDCFLRVNRRESMQKS